MNKEFLKVIVVFGLVVFIIIFSLFSTGQLISNSEESINMYSPTRTATLYSSAWYEIYTGIKNPFNVTRYPTFLFLGYVESLGASSYLIQAFYIASIMMFGLLSVYFFGRLILQIDSSISLIFGLFYLLNLFTLSQVWRRMLYSGMSLWAFLPFFLVCWVILTRKLNFKRLVIFAFGSFIFSNSFGHPAYTLVVWIPAIVYLMVEGIKHRKSQKTLFRIFANAFLLVLLWVAVNFWWLRGIIKLGSSYISTNTLSGDFNFGILKGLSVDFPTQQILLLRQSWWFGKGNHWFEFYASPYIYLASLVVLALTVYGWWSMRRHSYWIFLTILTLVGWFICKGSNPPLGSEFFQWLFTTFPFMGALRNSYEKFGLVFLFPYSIFFAFGIIGVCDRVKGFGRWLLMGFLVFIALVFLVWPIWSRQLFLNFEYVSVPESYGRANSYLNISGTERIMHLPSLEYNNAKFNWGYFGQNPYEYLFDRQSISGLVGIKLIDDYMISSEQFYRNENYLRLMGLIGIENIILHKDLIKDKSPVLFPEDLLNEWNGLSDSQKYDHFDIYTIDRSFVRPRLYIANKVKKVNSIDEGLHGLLINQFNNFIYGDLGDLKDSNPTMKYIKKSNGEYSVEIMNAVEPFVLVLNNTFDDNWMVVIDNKKIEKHFLINGLMNGWLIEAKGDFKVNVKFKS